MTFIALSLGLMLSIAAIAIGLAYWAAKRKERAYWAATRDILSACTKPADKTAKVIDIRSTRIGLGPMGSR